MLRDASGTTAAFEIPTSFTGDLLATMEARYADGSNAGPQSWTSYEEFDVTFAPDCDAGTITLTPPVECWVSAGFCAADQQIPRTQRPGRGVRGCGGPPSGSVCP